MTKAVMHLRENALGTNSLRGPNSYGPATLVGNWQEHRLEPNVAAAIQAEVVRQKKHHRRAVANMKSAPEDNEMKDTPHVMGPISVAGIRPRSGRCGHVIPSYYESIYSLSYNNDTNLVHHPQYHDQGGSIIAPDAVSPEDRWKTTQSVSYRATVIDPMDTNRRNPRRLFLPDEDDQFRPIGEYRSKLADYGAVGVDASQDRPYVGHAGMDSEEPLDERDFIAEEEPVDGKTLPMFFVKNGETARQKVHDAMYCPRLYENDLYAVRTDSAGPRTLHEARLKKPNVPDSEIMSKTYLVRKNGNAAMQRGQCDIVPVSLSYCGTIEQGQREALVRHYSNKRNPTSGRPDQ